LSGKDGGEATSLPSGSDLGRRDGWSSPGCRVTSSVTTVSPQPAHGQTARRRRRGRSPAGRARASSRRESRGAVLRAQLEQAGSGHARRRRVPPCHRAGRRVGYSRGRGLEPSTIRRMRCGLSLDDAPSVASDVGSGEARRRVWRPFRSTLRSAPSSHAASCRRSPSDRYHRQLENDTRETPSSASCRRAPTRSRDLRRQPDPCFGRGRLDRGLTETHRRYRGRVERLTG
jgi:hypothetical protein